MLQNNRATMRILQGKAIMKGLSGVSAAIQITGRVIKTGYGNRDKIKGPRCF
jgi:hypothetical protein